MELGSGRIAGGMMGICLAHSRNRAITHRNRHLTTARLAQSAERKALNLVVVGSSPTVGGFLRGVTCDIRNL